MAITSGFYNSSNGDRLYNAEQMTTYFEGIVSDGVYYGVGDRLLVVAGDNLGVNVGTGRGLVNLHWVKNDTVLPLTLTPADVQYDRIDYVIIKSDSTDSAREGTIEIKTGTPAANPAPPALVANNLIKEMPLAQIRVKKGATLINQSDITDLRPSSLCGWVTGIVQQVDTADLFLQWQTAYENYYADSTAAFDAYFAEKQAQFEGWFDDLQTMLGVNTALTQHKSVQVATANGIEFSLNIPEYESGDTLFLFVDGVHFTHELENLKTRGYDCAVIGVGESAVINFYSVIKTGTAITAICLKSEIDGDSVGAVIDEINGEVI